MMEGTQAWVVQWLDGRIEVHEEHAQEASAQRRARSLGSKVIKVYRRVVVVEKPPFQE